jgi:hypothetical protein
MLVVILGAVLERKGWGLEFSIDVQSTTMRICNTLKKMAWMDGMDGMKIAYLRKRRIKYICTFHHSLWELIAVSGKQYEDR